MPFFAMRGTCIPASSLVGMLLGETKVETEGVYQDNKDLCTTKCRHVSACELCECGRLDTKGSMRVKAHL